jgi:hypothetical protein
VAPLARQDVIDSVQFSIAFFATLLTGEAVIFAISFSPSSGWPSLREIDSHIAFREWVVAGWVAAMLTAIGLPGGSAIPALMGLCCSCWLTRSGCSPSSGYSAWPARTGGSGCCAAPWRTGWPGCRSRRRGCGSG